MMNLEFKMYKSKEIPLDKKPIAILYLLKPITYTNPIPSPPQPHLRKAVKKNQQTPTLPTFPTLKGSTERE